MKRFKKLWNLLSWKEPKIDIIPKEWIWCQECKRKWKIEPDETPDDCAKRFGLKRVNKKGDVFDENGAYICENCLK